MSFTQRQGKMRFEVFYFKLLVCKTIFKVHLTWGTNFFLTLCMKWEQDPLFCYPLIKFLSTLALIVIHTQWSPFEVLLSWTHIGLWMCHIACVPCSLTKSNTFTGTVFHSLETGKTLIIFFNVPIEKMDIKS